MQYIQRMNISEARLIAYLLSDGGISKGGDNGYYLYLRNIDAVLLTDFSKILKSFGLKPYSRFYQRAFEIRVGNKQLASKLLKLCKNFRMQKYQSGEYPDIRIPRILLENNKFSREFIKVFASCEGYIKFSKGKWITRRVTIGCTHPKLRRYLRTMLMKHQIETKENKVEVLIYGQKNLIKFASIGFVKGCKIHKGNFAGIERNRALHDMLRSYSISLRAKRP
jgi:hypothetical protein